MLTNIELELINETDPINWQFSMGTNWLQDTVSSRTHSLGIQLVERRNTNHQFEGPCLRIARNWQFRTKVLTVWTKVGAVPGHECSQDKNESPTQKRNHLVWRQSLLVWMVGRTEWSWCNQDGFCLAFSRFSFYLHWTSKCTETQDRPEQCKQIVTQVSMSQCGKIPGVLESKCTTAHRRHQERPNFLK